MTREQKARKILSPLNSYCIGAKRSELKEILELNFDKEFARYILLLNAYSRDSIFSKK